jgi:hypothetical protein
VQQPGAGLARRLEALFQLGARLAELVQEFLVLQRPDAGAAQRGVDQAVVDLPVHPPGDQLTERGLHRRQCLLGGEGGGGEHERDNHRREFR